MEVESQRRWSESVVAAVVVEGDVASGGLGGLGGLVSKKQSSLGRLYRSIPRMWGRWGRRPCSRSRRIRGSSYRRHQCGRHRCRIRSRILGNNQWFLSYWMWEMGRVVVIYYFSKIYFNFFVLLVWWCICGLLYMTKNWKKLQFFCFVVSGWNVTFLKVTTKGASRQG